MLPCLIASSQPRDFSSAQAHCAPCPLRRTAHHTRTHNPPTARLSPRSTRAVCAACSMHRCGCEWSGVAWRRVLSPHCDTTGECACMLHCCCTAVFCGCAPCVLLLALRVLSSLLMRREWLTRTDAAGRGGQKEEEERRGAVVREEREREETRRRQPRVHPHPQSPRAHTRQTTTMHPHTTGQQSRAEERTAEESRGEERHRQQTHSTGARNRAAQRSCQRIAAPLASAAHSLCACGSLPLLRRCSSPAAVSPRLQSETDSRLPTLPSLPSAPPLPPRLRTGSEAHGDTQRTQQTRLTNKQTNQTNKRT